MVLVIVGLVVIGLMLVSVLLYCVRAGGSVALTLAIAGLVLCGVGGMVAIRYGAIRQERDPYRVVGECEGRRKLSGHALDRCIDAADASHALRIAAPWVVAALATSAAAAVSRPR